MINTETELFFYYIKTITILPNSKIIFIVDKIDIGHSKTDLYIIYM